MGKTMLDDKVMLCGDLGVEVYREGKNGRVFERYYAAERVEVVGDRIKLVNAFREELRERGRYDETPVGNVFLKKEVGRYRVYEINVLEDGDVVYRWESK